MMQRFWTIVLAAVLYLAWGASDIAVSCNKCDIQLSEFSHNICNQESEYTQLPSNAKGNLIPQEAICTSSTSNNIFRLSTNSRTSTVNTSQNISSRNNLRYRTFTERIMAEAINSRLAGHTTKIFEYNPYTSSLRIAYYLHALCRLRI